MNATEEKTIVLPARDDMLARLIKVNDNAHYQQKLYPLILESAERELNGAGVVMMMQLAIADYTRGMPGMMANLLQLDLKVYIGAIVDDDEVLMDASDFIDTIEAKIQEDLDARPPAPARPELTEEQQVSLMRHAKRIAEIFDEHTNESGQQASMGHRAGGANPFYNQTLDGLYLEMYYGGVSKLWTPWGHWHFAAAQPYQVDLDAFLSRLTLETHMEEQNGGMGTIGPVYAILGIEGVELPTPQLPADKCQYLEYEVAKREWERLFELA